MKKFARIFILTTVFAAAVSSCEFISNLIGGEAAARLGKHVLYRAEVEEFVPKGLSVEDSTALARQYINAWAKENMFADVALAQLSKSELDVSRELEDYRRSLLRYRYEQRYINERLDTLVKEDEIREYYESHKNLFTLDVPVLKARYLNIMAKSPNVEKLKTVMSSRDYEELSSADSIAYSSALRYEDLSDTWVDAVSYAKKYDIEYAVFVSQLRAQSFVKVDNGEGEEKYVYVCELRNAGAIAPEEYCEDRIRDIILSGRKHNLLTTLERELLDDALGHEKLIIY